MFGYDNTALPDPVYLSWWVALEDVIVRQEELGWNPLSPKTIMGMALFRRVQQELPEHLTDKLLLYCAIGTAFDRWHGVDGFFVLGEGILTFDLSYGNKAEVKADILVTPAMLTYRPEPTARMIGKKVMGWFTKHNAEHL